MRLSNTLLSACLFGHSLAHPLDVYNDHFVTAIETFNTHTLSTTTPKAAAALPTHIPSDVNGYSDEEKASSVTTPSTTDVQIECQDCLTLGADVHLAFDIGVLFDKVQPCSATLLLNGVPAVLTQGSASTDLLVSALDAGTIYHVLVDSLCVSGLDREPVDGLPKDTVIGSSIEIQVTVLSINAKPPSRTLGLAFTADPQGISTPRIYHEAQATETDHTSSAEPTAIPSCSSRLHQKADCVAKSLGRKFGQVVDAALSIMGRALGEERVSHYRESLQAVVAAIDEDAICANAKAELSDTIANMTAETRPSAEKSTDTGSTAIIKSIKSQSTLVKILELIAGIVGVGTLFAIIRQRCCSLRRKVERLADREERIKAREYRRAARQEARRKRWARIRGAFLCGAGNDACDADEEKQTLVHDAAAMGENDDLGEARAQLDTMYHIHNIAHQTYRQRASSQFSHHARSHNSSLPSYNSEMLPGYTSQPESDDEGYRRVADGFVFRPSASATSSRCTPNSSIPALSPRHSLETLRTDGSLG